MQEFISAPLLLFTVLFTSPPPRSAPSLPLHAAPRAAGRHCCPPALSDASHGKIPFSPLWTAASHGNSRPSGLGNFQVNGAVTAWTTVMENTGSCSHRTVAKTVLWDAPLLLATGEGQCTKRLPIAALNST